MKTKEGDATCSKQLTQTSGSNAAPKSNPSAAAIEVARRFCENHGLREHFIENDLARAFQAAIDEAVTKAVKETSEYIMAQLKRESTSLPQGD